ncbi:MAG: sulfite exporter TauE/SafE family protein [Pseudomonadota bacterium]|nr:sulfite exporter TauE/SafE family protein [Pseudomonadota bacterium]
MPVEWLTLYFALGLAAGFMAGLLGVGGGLIMVPVLTWAFLEQGFSATYNIHLALGTSLGVIVITAISSMKAHHGHGAVDWGVFKRITPGIVLGTLAGAWLAAMFSDRGLKVFFTCFLFYVATQMLLGFRPKAARTLPGLPGMSAAGGVIGMVSSWVGIGGGTLTVPFLSWCNVRMQAAIGTSAAIGLPIAVSGALGYMLSGRGIAGLPEWSLGFVYLPALATIAAGSWLTAPFGARKTHTWPVATLKRVFAGLLYLLGVRMAYGLLAG